MNCENTYKHTFSRARVRAHWQGVLSFCCHKCHRLLVKSLFSMLLWVVAEGNLTNGWDNRPKRTLNHREKHIFPRCFFSISPNFLTFLSNLLRFSSLCVTLVTAKKQHCGWNARTHTRARETHRNLSFSFSPLSFSFPSCSSVFTFSFALCFPHSFLRLCLVLKCFFARWGCHFVSDPKKKVLFSLIFSLFGAISTHIPIEVT